MPAAAKPAKPTPSKPKKQTKSLAAQLAEELAKDTPTAVASSGGINIRLIGVIPTGCPTLDAAIGRGGYPMGRLSVLTGVEAGGKTTMALHAIVQAQRMGGMALYLDAEHKLDLDYVEHLGVDMDQLILSKPPHIEASLKMMAKVGKMCNPDKPFIIVLDSINASRAKAEIEGEVDDQHISPQARVLSAELPRLIQQVGNKKIVLLWISQPRENINFMGSSKNLIAGGGAVKFYTSLAVQIIRLGFLRYGESDKSKPIGSLMVAKVIKNQVAVPFKEAKFQIRWGHGVDYDQSLLERAIQLKLASKSGGWYELMFNDEVIKWQGIAKFAKVTMKRPEIAEWLDKKVRESYT